MIKRVKFRKLERNKYECLNLKSLKFYGRLTMRKIKRINNNLNFGYNELKIYKNLIIKKKRNIHKRYGLKWKYIIETNLEKDKFEAIKKFYRKEQWLYDISPVPKKIQRYCYNHEVNEAVKIYLDNGDNPDKSIFYEKSESMLQNTDTPDGRLWYGDGINYIEEHEKVISKLNKEIETYGLEKLITRVDEKTFFKNNYSENYDKKTFVIEELELVPRLLKLNGGYIDIYMIRNNDYKKLFKFAMFDYQVQYEEMLNYYKICCRLYPKIMPEISEDLFNRFLEVAREIENRIWKEK